MRLWDFTSFGLKNMSQWDFTHFELMIKIQELPSPKNMRLWNFTSFGLRIWTLYQNPRPLPNMGLWDFTTF